MNVKRGITLSVGIVLPSMILMAAGFFYLHGRYPIAMASSPRQEQARQERDGKPAPSVLSANERDEAAILLAVLRLECDEQKATHVGLEQKEDLVADPIPAMMEALLTARPALQPASDLVKPGVKGRMSRFTLITVGDLKWESKNRVRVRGIYRSAGHSDSSHHFVATRGKSNKTNSSSATATPGWVLEHRVIACGHWDQFTILRDGKPTIIGDRIRDRSR